MIFDPLYFLIILMPFPCNQHHIPSLRKHASGANSFLAVGAFYLFVNIKKLTNDSMKFCKDLLEDVGVAVVPGIGFGMDGYFRFSYATDEKSIEEGIKRIKAFTDKNYKK